MREETNLNEITPEEVITEIGTTRTLNEETNLMATEEKEEEIFQEETVTEVIKEGVTDEIKIFMKTETEMITLEETTTEEIMAIEEEDTEAKIVLEETITEDEEMMDLESELLSPFLKSHPTLPLLETSPSTLLRKIWQSFLVRMFKSWPFDWPRIPLTADSRDLVMLSLRTLNLFAPP